MSPSLSISNILQALYEDSPTIKMYVDAIAAGQPVPYTLITKTEDHEKNEAIVQRVRDQLEKTTQGVDADQDDLRELLLEFLDEAMILEEEMYEVVMFKGDEVVDGSKQLVKGDKIANLKQYAEFKGYEFSARKLDENDSN